MPSPTAVRTLPSSGLRRVEARARRRRAPAMPATRPTRTRIGSLIQPRLNARLRKKTAAATSAKPPIQASARPANRSSRSRRLRDGWHGCGDGRAGRPEDATAGSGASRGAVAVEWRARRRGATRAAAGRAGGGTVAAAAVARGGHRVRRGRSRRRHRAAGRGAAAGMPAAAGADRLRVGEPAAPGRPARADWTASAVAALIGGSAPRRLRPAQRSGSSRGPASSRRARVAPALRRVGRRPSHASRDASNRKTPRGPEPCTVSAIRPVIAPPHCRAAARAQDGVRLEMGLDPLRERSADARHGGDLLDGRLADPLRGAEDLEQLALALRADARQVVEGGPDGPAVRGGCGGT